MNWGSWLREGNIYKRALNGVDFGKFKDGGGKYSYYYWSGLVSGQRRWLLRRKRVSSRGHVAAADWAAEGEKRVARAHRRWSVSPIGLDPTRYSEFQIRCTVVQLQVATRSCRLI